MREGGAKPETAKIGSKAGAAQVFVECRLSIREMALWIAEARLVICVDNGVKHLAVAMDTPSLALFGPCDERQWGAIRNPHKHGVVRGCAWDLTPEERVGLTEDHQMRCITTHQVRNALNEMLTEH
jgi:ADP-heptose:LPS heptosyltransferase